MYVCSYSCVYRRSFHTQYLSHTDSNDVYSVTDTNSLNPQDRLRQSLATVWHHTHTPLLIAFTGSTGPVVHLHGLTGSRMPSVQADLVIYTHMLGVPGQCQSVALMLGYKLDFSCCVNKEGFCKSMQLHLLITKLSQITTNLSFIHAVACFKMGWHISN